MQNVSQKRIAQIKLNLLQSKGWRYLRYMHLRDFIASKCASLSRVGVVGSGLGFAELAIALEFPQIEWYLTDIVAEGRPNYHRVMELVLAWDVRNVRFGVWDILKPAPMKFDAVVSTEVLEHIREAEVAYKQILSASKKYAYTLVPYATDVENSDAAKRLNVYIEAGHFVCGFDGLMFRAIEPNGTVLRGVYWHNGGFQLRNKLVKLSSEEIFTEKQTLELLAETDRIDLEPQHQRCFGIKAIVEL